MYVSTSCENDLSYTYNIWLPPEGRDNVLSTDSEFSMQDCTTIYIVNKLTNRFDFDGPLKSARTGECDVQTTWTSQWATGLKLIEHQWHPWLVQWRFPNGYYQWGNHQNGEQS